MRTALLAILWVSRATAVLAAGAPVKVYVNGVRQTYDPPAVLRAGTVLDPLRAGARSLGVSAKWRADTQVASICTEEGCTAIRKSEGIVVNGSLLVPLRTIGEATGATIHWHPQARVVSISTPRVGQGCCG